MAENRPLRIALVSAEVAPFAKTGGLADVVAALARTLWRQGHDVRVFLPLYGRLRSVPEVEFDSRETSEVDVEFGGKSYRLKARTAPLPNSERQDGTPLEVELLDCPALFHREGYYTSDADEPVRWAAFTRGVLGTFQQGAWAPDVVHCNDWHTGLLPLYLRTTYAWDQLFADTRTLLSIHNLGYTGTFGAGVIDQLGLEEVRGLFHQEHLEEGQVSFLETGLLHASWLSTVSETYAREIQTPEHGMGLDELLKARDDHLVGIVNGIDPAEWSPEADALIPASFSASDLSGKKTCRDALLEALEVEPAGDDVIVAGIVSRMTGQKGFELLPDVLSVLLQREDMRLVVLGSGEERHERYFRWLRERMPHKVGVHLGYSEELAHGIEAGSDLFLMPSRYEPCGLNQMYSLAYGCVPLVRHTGGLADTVERWDPEARTGTGFVFYDFTPDALLHTFEHALEVWRDREAWASLVRNGMAQDFSWESQAAKYVDLYRRLGS